MSEPLVLTNAWVVTPERVFLGTVEVLQGHVVAVYRGTTAHQGAVDLEGDYLVPGLVELHTDNLEKVAQPRPGVRWPSLHAVIAHDAQIVAAGITTVFDALSLGDTAVRDDTKPSPRDLVDAIEAADRKGLTRSRHHLHLRCEVGGETLMEELDPLVDRPLVGLVSVMDHAPGQRQYADTAAFRLWYETKYGMDEDGVTTLMERQIADSEIRGDDQRQAVVDLCHRRQLPLASHDDATPDHVAQSVAEGGVIAEFPTTEAAARAAHGAGLKVLMGAPNLMRGGSHSGNVSALDLAFQGTLDILSSDYFPSSLMQAAFDLHRGPARLALHEAIATVTSTPARAAGFTDRGDIAPGKRADLARVWCPEGVAIVREVWRDGKRVF